MGTKKIVIAGGTGFIGKFLKANFQKRSDTVIIISRKNGDVNWEDEEGMRNAINDADLIINLAGKSVDCRYNEKNKQAILHSRLSTTQAIGEVIARCALPPKLWINSSTATIYRHAEDRPMTEKNSEIGEGFSVSVAKQWEKVFFNFQLPNTRQVALRMAIVIGKEGGAFLPLKNLVKFGLGGMQGNGKQVFSWIHIEDIFQIILFLMEHEQLHGVFNCSSPNPVTNAEFMRLVRKALQIKIGLPSPAWLLEFGAIFIRTETELILKSRWVLPERLLQSGYIFVYPKLTTALKEITA